MTEHKTKTLMFEGQEIEIDCKIATLMRLLWKRGIRTRWSCEGDKDVADIIFWNYEDAEKFLYAVFEYKPTCHMVGRPKYKEIRWRAYRQKYGWHIGLVYLFSDAGGNERRLFPKVEFPQSDIEELEEIFK